MNWPRSGAEDEETEIAIEAATGEEVKAMTQLETRREAGVADGAEVETDWMEEALMLETKVEARAGVEGIGREELEEGEGEEIRRATGGEAEVNAELGEAGAQTARS